MTDIWLVRHGEAAAGFGEDTDPGLSVLGRQQAEHAAALLAEQEQVGAEAALLSSPKLRAIQTGEPFATAIGAQLQIDARFIELPSPSALAVRQDWIMQVLRSQWSELPDTVQAWRQDIVAAIDGMNRATVVFTHFLVINAVAARISGDDTVMQCLPANGSVHHLRIDAGRWQWMKRGEMLQSVVN